MKTSILILAVFFLISQSAFAASVSGKANFSGTPPALPKLDMKADPVCSGAHPDGLASEEVTVNSNGTLKDVFVYVKEGLEGKTFPASKDKITLDQNGCHYSPHVFGAQVNQPVEILNSDATLHNVHGMAKVSKEFNLGMPIKGMKVNRKFDKPEIMVKFKCDVHPWMSAYAGILPHPFFAVTGEDGSFEIKDLPPGKYVLGAWQEKYGTQTQEITVDETGKTDVNFNFAG